MEKENILARKEWTCCDICGGTEIETERETFEKKLNKKYNAFVYYHMQDANRIFNQCLKYDDNNNIDNINNNNTDKIQTYLSWDYFYDDNYDIPDKQGLILGKKIQDIGKKANVLIEFSNLDKRLILKI